MGARAAAATWIEGTVGSCVVMGANDPLDEEHGWSPVDDRLGPLVRWIEEEAELRLDVPPGATHIGIEVWVTRTLIGRSPTLELGVHDVFVPKTDEHAVDVGFRLRPGRGQVLECPLRP